MTAPDETPPAPDIDIVCVTLNPALDRTYEVHNLQLGQHVKGRLVSVQPAGKAVNVARVLQNLGRKCVLTGFVGEEDRRLFENSFDSLLVRTQLFGTGERTRENVTLMDIERGVETHVREEGGIITEDDLQRLLKKLRILCRGGNWAVFAGSLPRGIGSAEMLELLIAVERAGSRIILDSSGGMRAALGRVPVWLVKPNREELAELAAEDVSDEQSMLIAARKLLPHIEMLLVSAGDQGAYLVSRQETLHAYIKELPRPVTNTVGCGDALLAGFLEAMASGQATKDALRRAVAVATSALFRVGAGDVGADEALELAKLVTVYKM
jgi:1-phosphofructokinase family hexose kinase